MRVVFPAAPGEKVLSLKNLAFWSKNWAFRRYALDQYDVALKNESLTQGELHDLNWGKRKALVAHAYESSAFYKRLYDGHSFHPRDLRTPEDWRRVPSINKRDVASGFEDIVDRRAPKSRRIVTTTGGSTGEPLRTIRDRGFPEEILKWRMLRRWSCGPDDDMLMLWRMPQHAQRIRHRIANTLLWWPTQRYKFDVASVDEHLLMKIAEVLVKKKPRIIWGYVGAVESLAWFIERHSIQLGYTPIVWITAAPVSTIQWQLFQRVFGSSIVDQYACSEVHWIAGNVPGERALAIEYDYRHVDVLVDGGEPAMLGEVGSIVITDLHNKVFPLIKYQVGDRAAILEHGSDTLSAFPRLSPVKGRVSEAIRTPSGITVSGEYLTTIFDEYTDFVAQFQVFQGADFAVSIRVRFRKQPSIAQLSQVERVRISLEQRTRNEIPIDWVESEDIASDAGKVRFIRSELAGAVSSVE